MFSQTIADHTPDRISPFITELRNRLLLAVHNVCIITSSTNEEIVGLPNPATLYLLDIYPHLLEQFHLWHRRMGIKHSPLDSMGCC